MSPTAVICTRYFLDIADHLLPVEEEGRCVDYWRMWTQAGDLEKRIRNCTDTHFEPPMREKLAILKSRIDKHLDECPICRAWIARCELYANRGRSL